MKETQIHEKEHCKENKKQTANLIQHKNFNAIRLNDNLGTDLEMERATNLQNGNRK